MNRVTCSAFLLLIMSSFSSDLVFASDPVTINITGTIVASPCEVDPDSVTKNVDLGDIDATELAGGGVTLKPVMINLINCPAGVTQVVATFHGTPGPVQPDRSYANTGTAKNVEIGLEKDLSNGLGNGKTYTVTPDSGKANFSLFTYARAVGTPTPGSVSAVVTMSFEYN